MPWSTFGSNFVRTGRQYLDRFSNTEIVSKVKFAVTDLALKVAFLIKPKIFLNYTPIEREQHRTSSDRRYVFKWRLWLPETRGEIL